MNPSPIKICPTCNSHRIRQVKRDVESTRRGKTFTAHGVLIEECPDCGERLFSPESLDEIAAQRPPATKPVRRRKTA